MLRKFPYRGVRQVERDEGEIITDEVEQLRMVYAGDVIVKFAVVKEVFRRESSLTESKKAERILAARETDIELTEAELLGKGVSGMDTLDGDRDRILYVEKVIAGSVNLGLERVSRCKGKGLMFSHKNLLK